ncbi:MAG: RluA family pseudouridine synthase [Gammaproteobacteria bacterium]|nr:MAG: RluA family pseudouridine synthase [Gammaproteobacteria bacterium]
MPEARPGVRKARVSEQEAGQRIDNYLRRVLGGVPKSAVYRVLRKGQVRVNGRRIKPEYRLQPGDEVRIPPLHTEEKAHAEPPAAVVADFEQWVLVEDEWLMIVNKPAGIAVHAGSGLSWGLIDVARAARPNAPFLELAHRLDRETSGCLILAKERRALNSLHDLLRTHRGMDKRYLALVAGRWQGGVREVRLDLGRVEGGREKMGVVDEGREAVSRFRPLQRLADATLMEVRIDTGRTHQIRVQAAHLGHPVLGDERYGDHRLNREWRRRGLKRMFLHAWQLEFRLPLTGTRYQAEAPLPDALKTLLDGLEPA